MKTLNKKQIDLISGGRITCGCGEVESTDISTTLISMKPSVKPSMVEKQGNVIL